MTDKIFGYDWDVIRRAQQRDMYGLRRPIENNLPCSEWTDADQRLLDQYQTIEALEQAGFYGVADRVKRQCHITV